MNHSPEPWTIAKRRGEKNVVDVVSKAEPHIQIIVANREDAERIVACVNTCEGIPTADLINGMGTLEMLREMAAERGYILEKRHPAD